MEWCLSGVSLFCVFIAGFICFAPMIEDSKRRERELIERVLRQEFEVDMMMRELDRKFARIERTVQGDLNIDNRTRSKSNKAPSLDETIKNILKDN